ncbi:MAG: Asp23/Gls24 family envelope stress response protein [Clostridiales bacterium]|nr:Asp23/Gls24 family envelope stress response protein [Clostridiales bacterium]
MAIKIMNSLGTISISNDIIKQEAALTAAGCYAVAGLADKNGKKDKAEILSADELFKGIDLKIADNSLYIDVHIIVNYGASIQSVGDNIIEAVKAKVLEMTGVKVADVKVYIEGISME